MKRARRKIEERQQDHKRQRLSLSHSQPQSTSVPAQAPGNNPAHPLNSTQDSPRRHHNHDLVQYIVLDRNRNQLLDIVHTAVTH